MIFVTQYVFTDFFNYKTVNKIACTMHKQPFRGVLRKRCSENKYAANLQESTHAEV